MTSSRVRLERSNPDPNSFHRLNSGPPQREHRRTAATALFWALLLVSLFAPRPAGAAGAVDPDRIANIKSAAAIIGQIQRQKGAEGAIDFVTSCYRTHEIASKYTPGYERCLTQDYILTRMLTAVYSQVPADQASRRGLANPQALTDSMVRRLAGAFDHYKVPVTEVDELKKLVDQHGFPAYLAIVFPDAVRKQGKQPPSRKQ